MPLDNSEQYENPIPVAVRRAAERANELARGQNNAPADNLKVDEPKAEEPKVDEPKADEPKVEPPTPAPSTDWEQQYRTLRGKYDAEVPLLNDMVARQERELTSVRQLLATMQSAPPAAAPEPTTIVPIELPAEVVEEYGEDFVKVMRRVARAELDHEIKAELKTLRDEITQLRGGQQRVETQTVQQRVESGLSAVPELAGGVWQQLNHDPKFMAWLQQVDDFAGQQRIVLFRDAAASGDVNRTARFFTAYLSEHTAPTPAPTPAMVQTPAAPQTADQRPTLESLAAPGRATGTAATGGASSEKRVWTRSQIARVYRDASHGVYNGRDEEFRRVEQDIIEAAREGRVRG